MDLGTIDSERYWADSKRVLVEFLGEYLADDHADLWAQVGAGVEVWAEEPDLPRFDADGNPVAFTQPVVTVEIGNDEVVETFLNSAQAQHLGEHHAMAFRISAQTDSAVGGAITRDDLIGAVQQVFGDHKADLELAGFGALRRGPATIEDQRDLGLYVARLDVLADVDVLGEAQRTLEVELARFAFTATGDGTFSEGIVLETDSDLRVKLLTGTGTQTTSLTVTALNQDGDAKTLTGYIPRTRSEGTYIALTSETPGDTYTEVTNITVTASSGQAGEAFAVVNIPKEL